MEGGFLRHLDWWWVAQRMQRWHPGVRSSFLHKAAGSGRVSLLPCDLVLNFLDSFEILAFGLIVFSSLNEAGRI